MGIKNKLGFTLIELLIVVAIIAILAAIAIPNFLAAQVRSKVARVKSELRTLNTGLETYYVDNNQYPPEYLLTTEGPVVYVDPLRSFMSFVTMTTPVAYLTSIPMDIFKRGSQFDPPAYWYYNWLQRYGDSINPGHDWGWPSFYDTEAAGIMVSLGPSQNFVAGYQVYDPSNGTVSLGYISRMFPGGEGSR